MPNKASHISYGLKPPVKPPKFKRYETPGITKTLVNARRFAGKFGAGFFRVVTDWCVSDNPNNN